MPQELSPQARRDKAARDKRYAMTTRRTRMKAENTHQYKGSGPTYFGPRHDGYSDKHLFFTSVNVNRSYK